MKVVRKILYVIAGILILLTIIIVACAYNPGLTSAIQGVIFRGKTVEVSSVSQNEAAAEPVTGTEVSGNTATNDDHRMRSLEELGIPEEDLITSIEDYYRNCHDQIVEHGVGTYSFENVIANEPLVQEIYAKYSNRDYVEGYMNETLNEVGAASYEMNLLVEELTEKRFRLTHQIELNEGQ